MLTRTISMQNYSDWHCQTKPHRALFKMLRDVSLLVLTGLIMRSAGLNDTQITHLMTLLSGISRRECTSLGTWNQSVT